MRKRFLLAKFWSVDMKIVHTIDEDVVLGCVDLTSTEGVIRGPFGNIIGFYNYEKDITTNERGYILFNWK